MLTSVEIEAAIDALPHAEQQGIFSRLADKLSHRAEEPVEDTGEDPLLALLDRLSRELPSEPRTNVAADYKKCLYGSDG